MNPDILKRVKQMAAEGAEPRKMAEKVGRSTRQVGRYLRHLGLTKRRESITEAQHKRIEALLSEGMWLTWIAEDLGLDYRLLRERFRPGVPEDFYASWQFIRQRPELLDLHREFAPKVASKGRV